MIRITVFVTITVFITITLFITTTNQKVAHLSSLYRTTDSLFGKTAEGGALARPNKSCMPV